MKVNSPAFIKVSVLVLLCAQGIVACSDASTCHNDMGETVLCTPPDMASDLDEAVEDMTIVPDLPAPMVDMPDDMTEDVPGDMPDMPDLCTPMLEATVCNNVCGMQLDGCGGTIDCGQPLTQEMACAGTCGMQSDGCGGTIECEPCACNNGQPVEPRCGACQLGESTCEGDTFVCNAYDIPGLDENTDCDSALVYVSKRSNSEMPDGSVDAPFSTLAEASQAALDRGARLILVGGTVSDVYSETLEMHDGISVVGGWSVDWSPEPTRIPTITPPTSASADIFGAQAIDIVDYETLLAHLTIKTPDVLPSTSGPGHHNYGLYVRNGSQLKLEHMTIEAGQGGDGANGSIGESGFESNNNGADGAVGLFSTEYKRVNYPVNVDPVPADPDFFRPYDFGGFYAALPVSCNAGVIGVYDSVTSRGGMGGSQLNDSSVLAPATVGSGARGGAPLSAGGMAHGRNGRSLSDPAGNGEGGEVNIDVRNNFFAYGGNSNGQQGEPGEHGEAGGGGASAAQQSALSLLIEKCGLGGCTNYTFGAFGPRGADGGRGGCGGNGGEGGFAGGSSLGMFLVNSVLSIDTSVITSSRGGTGGQGGLGGNGGDGGTGGSGTDKFCNGYGSQDCQTIAGVYSGDGGDGGKGQEGGIGGSGAGGSSFGVYCVDAQLMKDTSTSVQTGSPGVGGRGNGAHGGDGLSDVLFDCN